LVLCGPSGGSPSGGSPSGGSPSGGSSSACRDADVAESILLDPALEVLASTDAPAGAQGVRVLTVASAATGSRVVVRAKWRAWSTAAGFSRPRYEVAAHAVQRLFLAPHEWVVPATRVACLPLDAVRREIDPDATPTWPGAACVAGALSTWIEGAASLDEAYDEGTLPGATPLDAGLFAEDAVYRRNVADLNLLSHLVAHGDAHREQFVVVRGARGPRLWLVDSSIAFSGFRNPDLVNGPWDWSTLHVAASSRASVGRLRALVDADLARLAVVEQLAVRGDRWVVVPRTDAGQQVEEGLRRSGGALQVGLERTEIRKLRRRLRAVLADVDAGRRSTF
jgi:hypothetical protein